MWPLKKKYKPNVFRLLVEYGEMQNKNAPLIQICYYEDYYLDKISYFN